MSLITSRFNSFKRREFLEYLSVSGNVAAAARAVGLDSSTVRKHYQGDEQFRDEWDNAIALAGGSLEEAVYRRARFGIPRKLWYQGEPVIDPETGQQAIEVSYDASRDALLLKRFMPEQYRERTDVRVSGGLQTVNMDDEALVARARQIIDDRDLRSEGTVDEVTTVEFREIRPEDLL